MGRVMATTSVNFDGFEIGAYVGPARGVVVRTPTITQSISARFQTAIGGAIGSYTAMCETARDEAYRLMIAQAEALGADAVLTYRYSAAEIAGVGTEVICYGTAVMLHKHGDLPAPEDKKPPTSDVPKFNFTLPGKIAMAFLQALTLWSFFCFPKKSGGISRTR